MAKKTRSETKCPILGEVSPFSEHQLPKINDVLKHLMNTTKNLKNNGGPAYKNFNVSISNTVDEIKMIWSKTSIPTISKKRISFVLKKYYNRRTAVIKNHNKPCFENQVQSAKIEFDKLFDISACKCKHFNFCICTAELKVNYNFIILIRIKYIINQMDFHTGSYSRTKFSC